MLSLRKQRQAGLAGVQNSRAARLEMKSRVRSSRVFVVPVQHFSIYLKNTGKISFTLFACGYYTYACLFSKSTGSINLWSYQLTAEFLINLKSLGY